MVGDIRICVVGVELNIDRRRVREQGKFGGDGFLGACVVAEGGVWRLHEPVADLEGFVFEVGWLPDGEAGRVTVPVGVGFGDVAHEVQFLAGVVLVNILGLTIHCALEVIATVLYTPEPV